MTLGEVSAEIKAWNLPPGAVVEVSETKYWCGTWYKPWTWFAVNRDYHIVSRPADWGAANEWARLRGR